MSCQPTRSARPKTTSTSLLLGVLAPLNQVQPGQAMQVAQEVALLSEFAVQIWTPGVLASTMQSRTSCSIHGQVEPILSFQAHSRGEVLRQVALAKSAQSGTFV